MTSAATLGVVWLAALAFGFPGGRVAGATQAGGDTARTHGAPPAAARALHPAGAPSTPPYLSTSSSPAGTSVSSSSSASSVTGRPVTSGTAVKAKASPTRRAAAASTPPHGVPVTSPVLSAQNRCPNIATRHVMTVAPGNAGRLTVALTFDDGPGEDTDAVLKVLAREHVHATFFVIGREVAANPGLVRRESREGHLIGDHTYDHTYPRDLKGGWTSGYLSGQLRSTADLVRRETGLPTCFFRPPGGFMPRTVLPTARKLRMSTALWTVDTRDWAVQGPHAPAHASVEKQARTIAGRAVASGRPGAHPIVLFHDGGGFRGSTAASVDRVIRWYKARGYVFVRLDGKV